MRYEEILAEMVRASESNDTGLTAEEYVAATGLTKRKVLDMFRAAADRGDLIVGRRAGNRVDGRRVNRMTPTYRFKEGT